MFETGESLAKTRTTFLRVISGCYSLAFVSIYLQIDGLYGDKGILPVRTRAKDYKWEKFLTNTSLIWVRSWLGISASETMELLALLGGLSGFIGAVHKSSLNKINFVFMFLAYLTIFKLAQTFMWFQWDILMLEVGALAVLVAPFRGKTWFLPRPRDHITMMTVRFLLFRMMFGNGVVKLQSGCPMWWGLKAMPLHYESQCIPTWLAWFAYNVPPEFLHKLSVVVTFVTEIPVTLFFYHPVKSIRKFAFWLQILLMIGIMLTGNYNFFNFLYIGLCISLLDDTDLGKKRDPKPCQRSGFSLVATMSTLAGLTYLCFLTFYSPTVRGGLKVVPSRNQFDRMVSDLTPIGLGLGVLSMAYSFGMGLIKCLWPQEAMSRLNRTFGNFISLLVHTVAAVCLFCLSVPVFLRGINQQEIIAKSPQLSQMYTHVNRLNQEVEQLQIIHSYGLFRTMTGVGGRPEIIIEGADSVDGPWVEYNFLYKPGNVSSPLLPFVLPHQPRLDWQMWFAALGSYQQNPWLVSLIYRLMQGEPSVLALLDESKLPQSFVDSPPRVIRITAYKYHFTGPTNAVKGRKKNKKKSSDNIIDWWYRDERSEYLHPVSTDSLEGYLTQMGVLDKSHHQRSQQKSISPNFASKVLRSLRAFHLNFKPHFIVQQIFLAMLVTPLFIS